MSVRGLVSMANLTLNEFLQTYNSLNTHPVTEIEVSADDGHGTSPFIIIRQGDRVAVVNPLAFDEYLDIDVRSFNAGEPVTAQVMGMTPGKRHDWDQRVNLAIILIGGEQ